MFSMTLRLSDASTVLVTPVVLVMVREDTGDPWQGDGPGEGVGTVWARSPLIKGQHSQGPDRPALGASMAAHVAIRLAECG
jgi:hypothetical protein